MPEGRRLLLVDDDASTHIALTALLKSEGYQVDVCSSAAAALEHLRTHTYEFLVTDLVMGGMSGLELIEAARRIDLSLPCYVITGQEPPPEHERGHVRWLAKPIDIEVLLAALLDA